MAELLPLFASFAAVVGLVFTAISLRSHSKSNDANTLFVILNEIRMSESNLQAAAKEPDIFKREIVSYLNLLEILAATDNHNLLNRVTRKIARDRLINDIAILQSEEFTKNILESATTSPSTFKELEKFCRRNYRNIRKQEVIHQVRDTLQ